MRTLQETASWGWDEINEEPDADSGISPGYGTDKLRESYPSKADRGFGRSQ